MFSIKIDQFGGEIPRRSRRLLPELAAREAINCVNTAGDMRPLREPASRATSSKTGTLQTIYRAISGGSTAWFAWTDDVDVVKAPLPPDATARWCYTGDGVPKVTSYAMATNGAGNDYPNQYYALGVPKPLAAPSVSASGGTGASTSRAYKYTFFTQWGEESAASPESAVLTGKVDDTWAITGMDAFPANSGDISNVTYAGTSVTITSASNHYNRVGDEITVAGVTTVTNINGTWTITAIDTTAKTMTFTVTSTPTGTYDNATDTTDTWTRTVSWNVTSMKRRLYRTVGTSSEWQLVDDDVNTTHDDTLLDAQILGDVFLADGWDPPPAALAGLVLLPSGAAAGFVGDTIYLSEPYQLHAWPYTLQAKSDIVALGVFGNNIAVATQTAPEVASGVEPASMTLTRADLIYPCLSKRSMVSLGNACLYASSKGMVAIGDGGVDVFTKEFYTEEEWRLLYPSTMEVEVAQGIIYVSYTEDSVNKMIAFTDGHLIRYTVNASAMHTDGITGELFVAVGSDISEWDAPDSVNMNMFWKSREFILPEHANMGAFRLDIDSSLTTEERAALEAAQTAAETANAEILTTGNARGAINAYAFNETRVNGSDFSDVPATPDTLEATVKLYVNDVEKAEVSVADNLTHRLPSGYKADNFAVSVATTARVRRIQVADTPRALKGVA